MKTGICIVLAALCSAIAFAEVTASRRADGTLVITGYSPTPAASLAARRLPAPPAIDELIRRWAPVHAVDEALVRALIQVESGYDARALSKKGAMGLMQLMPETARDLGVSDPWDPEQNVRAGVSYLRQMLDRFDGDLELALAGYNAGPTAVDKYRGVPPYRETNDYVRKVLTLYRGGGESLVVLRRPARSSTSRTPPIRSRRDARGRLVLWTP